MCLGVSPFQFDFKNPVYYLLCKRTEEREIDVFDVGVSFFFLVETNVVVQYRGNCLDLGGRADASHHFAVYFFCRDDSEHPCTGEVCGMKVRVCFFQFGCVFHVVSELVKLVAHREVADKQIITHGLLRHFKPEIHELVVMYRVNDLFFSIFQFVPKPCMLVGVLAENVFSIQQRQQLEQHIDSLDIGRYSDRSKEELLERIHIVDDRRIFIIAELIRKGATYEEIHDITKIDLWFIDKIAHLVEMEQTLKNETLTPEILAEAKRMEFPDTVIANYTGMTEREIHDMRHENGIVASFKMVDTCAAEFEASTPYYYSVFGSETEVSKDKDRKRIMVLGSGPIRIGQGIEFDFCSVHSVWSLAQSGYETIIVNNNPETVSTDFDVADKLYFEPLTPEDVENIVDIEKPDGAVVQFGGQTAIKLTEALLKMGVPILGTSAENVDAAEDRELFDEILEQCKIPRPAGKTVFTTEEALAAANELGYPVLVRPSYVLGGQGMQIAINDDDIREFMSIINRHVQEHPILVDKYLMGKEVEVDAVCDGENILIPGIMEHVERAGIHSGDSISVYPAMSIKPEVQEVLVDYTAKLAKSLHVIGLINIQFIVYNDEVFVIEVNPRSSRTVPYISKVTGIPIVKLASRVILGEKITDMGYTPGLAKKSDYIAIKMPVFSFEKLRGAEISLGPEMKSTGECLGIAKTFNEALHKAFMGAGINLPKYKKMILTVNDNSKDEAISVARRFQALGYEIYATRGTAKFLGENGVSVIGVNKIEQESPTLMDLLLGHEIDLVIDIPKQGEHSHDGFLIRRTSIETGVTCLTSLDTANALLTALEDSEKNELTLVDIATIDTK